MSDVAKLVERLTGADGADHLNDIRQLYEFSESPDLTVVAEALQAIPLVLSHHRRHTGSGGTTGDNKVITDWLQQHTEAYHAALVQLALSKDPRGQVCAIRLFMAALAAQEAEARSLASAGKVATTTSKSPEMRVQHLLTELLVAERWSKHMVNCLTSEFVATYIDVRHYVLSHLKVCLGQVCKVSCSTDGALAAPPSKKLKRDSPFADMVRVRGLPLRDLFSRMFEILRDAPEPSPAPTSENGEDAAVSDCELLAANGRPAGAFLRDYRKLFQDTWLHLLSLRVPLEHCLPLLQLVPSRVMPHLSRPLMLADFYMRAFTSESLEVSVMSLSGLFLLLTKHSLGDPETLSSSSNEFYSQLYSLIKPETFQLAQRSRFQRLLAASLTSGLLPARFAAVFAKKCMCVAVAVPDTGTVEWLIAVTYGLIQKHHSHCKFLLHNPTTGSGTEQPAKEDPFSAASALTEALTQVPETSLWELKLLQRHHVPAVTILIDLFSKPFFKPSSKKLDPELFLDQSAGQLYKQALKSGDRQAVRWKGKGQACPLAFSVEDDALMLRLDGWAAALSTSQRRVGVGL